MTRLLYIIIPLSLAACCHPQLKSAPPLVSDDGAIMIGDSSVLGSDSALGLGIVVGLNGTGDGEFVRPFLARLPNVPKRQWTSTELRSVALVTLNAKRSPGGVIVVEASSLGEASNLAGGVLIPTVLMQSGTPDFIVLGRGKVGSQQENGSYRLNEPGLLLLQSPYAQFKLDGLRIPQPSLEFAGGK